MSVDLSHWLKVDITLKHKTDLSTTTISLTNRAELTDTVNDHWPILLTVSRLGASSDRTIVLPESGSFRILDSIGSFGVDRKFSDLLERYEIIDQPMTVYYAETEVTDNNPSYSSVFVGKVLDYEGDKDRNLPVLEIRFDARIFERRLVTKEINTTDHTSAPIQSIGKYLPMVIGEDVQVQPIMITAAGATNPQYAYATTYSTEHPVGGVQKYYCRSPAISQFIEVQSASNVSTAVFSKLVTDNYNIFGSGGSGDSTSLAHVLKSTSETTYNYIITQIALSVAGDSAPGSYEGTLTLTVIEGTTLTYGGYDFDGPSTKVLASAVRTTEDLDSSLDAGTYFDLVFTLEAPVVLESDKSYYLALTYDQSSTGAIRVATDVLASGNRLFYKTNSSGGWREHPTVPYENLYFSAYGLKFTDSPGGSHVGSSGGLGDAYFELSQKTAISGYSNPDISKLNWIVEIDGIKDDSGGSISGSANSVITRPHHAVKLLTQEYSGIWSLSSDWDFTDYSDTHSSANTLAGAIEGESTLEDAIAQICTNTASKIVLRKDGKLAVYSWGVEQTPVARFTQENSKVIRYGKLDSSYVVNNVKLGYDKQLIYFDSINLVSQGQPSDYTDILFINNSSVGYEDIIGDSVTLYGKRFLADNLYSLINTSAQASRLANYYIRNFNEPPIYVELEVPFEYYADLELQNVIKIKHPSLPTYFGGSPNTKLPHYDGEEIDVHNGNVLSRAKLYRAQIEGLRISFNQDAVPTLLLTCRLLTNEYDPT